jgi:hypothetical protein
MKAHGQRRGSGGASITVSGNSRCSGTSASYLNIGNPVAAADRYCWCQMVNAGISGAWVYLGDDNSASGCASDCVAWCATNVRYVNSNFRAAICPPPPSS